MLAWIRSPRGSAATTTAVVAVLALIWLVPSALQPRNMPSTSAGGQSPAPLASLPASSSTTLGMPAGDKAAEPAPMSSSVTAPPALVAALPTPTPASTPPSPAAAPAITTPAGASAAAPVVATLPDVAAISTATAPGLPLSNAPSGPANPGAPAFDIVRVEPSGDSVVAGRGTPGSEVTLADQGTVVARVTADRNGQFALLPPKLAEGDHYLTLRSTQDGKPTVSGQGVAVSVAKSGIAKPMVALITPDQPARVLSDGAAPPPRNAAGAPQPAVPEPVAIQSVQAGGGGKFMASGIASAGSQCRLYLNGAFLADVTTGKDGRWSVKVEKGMRGGQYTVRADELEPATGRVVNRAEVPFDYPAALETGRGQRMLMAKATPAAPLVPPSPLPAHGARPSPAAPPALVAAIAPSGVAPQPAVPGSGPTDAAAPASAPQGAQTAPVVSTPPTAVATAAPGASALDAASPNTAAQSGTAAPAAPLAPATTAEAGKASPESADAGVGKTSGQPVGPAASPSDASAAAAIVKELQTATVIRGDSLWRISRKMLGHGINYTQIYASNASQIRDPRLIYPGQIFVVPHRDAK